MSVDLGVKTKARLEEFESFVRHFVRVANHKMHPLSRKRKIRVLDLALIATALEALFRARALSPRNEGVLDQEMFNLPTSLMTLPLVASEVVNLIDI